jgi:predicted DNA-binding transcriptional regulator YafY
VNLQRCIDRSVIAVIDYVKEASEVEQNKEICPLQLFQSDGSWRVLAVNDGVIKQYLLNKILQLQATDRKFRRVAQDQIDNMFRYSFRSWVGSERHHVKLMLSGVWAARIKPRQLVEAQAITEGKDGSIVFEAIVNSLEEVASWVVSRGEGVTVLEPAELKDLVVSLAKGALRNYKDPRKKKSIII